MVNHPNRSTTSRNGKALAETIINAISGRAGIALNGEIVQSNAKRTKLFVGDVSIPTECLHANLTEHELHELENLPRWNGNNEWEISGIALLHVSSAIKRFNLKNDILRIDTDSNAGYYQYNYMQAQMKEMKVCFCHECSTKRLERE
jgi:hypothetical protein